VAIEYPLEVMDEIRAAAIEGLQRFARGGLEVAGVLFGVRRERGIRILTWRPISCEHSLGPTLQLSERDRVLLTRSLEAASKDPDLQGLRPVGWFLSHTRNDVLLAPHDLEVFDRCFPEPWQVTLVLRPTQGGVARAGFFVRQTDGMLKSDSSYQEFVVKPLHRASQLADVPVAVAHDRPDLQPQKESSSTESIATNGERMRPGRAEPMLFRTLDRPRTRPLWLWMLPVILGLIITGFLFKENYLANQNQEFSFHVNDAGGAVQIVWDPNATPIRNAHLGAIDIKDSGETKRYPLADVELHSGKMSYTRRGGDLELRMTVYPVGFNPIQEYVHFLDPGPATPQAVPSEVDQLRKERDQLQAEVNRLKQDLQKERTPRRRKR
jgi:hypothetical protein